MSAATPFPLQWPAGRERRAPGLRKSGKFNKKQWKSYESGGGYNQTVDISVADALSRLQEELDRIGARYPVVSSNLETRLDGMPRSGQRKPPDPGVAVYFQLGGEPHCLPCDTYQEVAHNIAAVAAHIEATRAVERHGVASVREMFQGFVSLPAPGASKPWREVLQMPLPIPAKHETIVESYRRLARIRHPDAGGSDGLMAELNAARDQALREISP